MRITHITLAVSLALAMGGTASAQGVGITPTGPGMLSGGILGGGENPAGVIDGTNPNPNPYQAGGILSPERNAGSGITGPETTGSIRTGAPRKLGW